MGKRNYGKQADRKLLGANFSKPNSTSYVTHGITADQFATSHEFALSLAEDERERDLLRDTRDDSEDLLTGVNLSKSLRGAINRDREHDILRGKLKRRLPYDHVIIGEACRLEGAIDSPIAVRKDSHGKSHYDYTGEWSHWRTILFRYGNRHYLLPYQGYHVLIWRHEDGVRILWRDECLGVSIENSATYFREGSLGRYTELHSDPKLPFGERRAELIRSLKTVKRQRDIDSISKNIAQNPLKLKAIIAKKSTEPVTDDEVVKYLATHARDPLGQNPLDPQNRGRYRIAPTAGHPTKLERHLARYRNGDVRPALNKPEKA
jgi:hypothetical protein